MSLPASTRVGPYEIISLLGEGGMGAVYRARDAKLNRDVAIKVLLPVVANDPDRLARFSREAQVLASLNHSNIAHIYGIEEARGVTALVMELVEGEDLSQRIARGAIPIDEALPIARQIAEALEAAHEHGIVHRDLKPANIKVRPDGTVKVLDFGLAKAIDPAAGSSMAAMNSPTLSIHATEAGLILGTAAYMSPEQAAGKSVDKRTDLWAFGVVLLEMLTGRPAFEGETVSHVIAAVLKDQPDWSALPPTVPSAIHKLLRRCLEKDRKRRLDSASAARLDIDDTIAARGSDSGVTDAHDRPSSRRRTPVLLAVAFAIGAVVTGLAVWTFAKQSSSALPADVVRFGIHDTDRVIVSRSDGDIALSPDGRTLAFVGFGEGGPRIWLRDLDTADARALLGTEGARQLGWSPDGKSLAFMASFRIKKVAVAGSTPEVLSQTRLSDARSPVWTPNGTILYADNNGFWSVAANGGGPVAQVVPVPGTRHEPTAFLPGGRHFLERVQSTDPAKAGTWATAFDATTRTRLLTFPVTARYAAGQLLFVRDRVLYGQAFDVAALRLDGEPRPLAQNAADGFSVSTLGTVAYRPVSAAGPADATQLEWIDRSGRILERIEQAAGANFPTLSPDQRRVAISRSGGLWVLELTRAVLSQITINGTSPRWAPDGRRLIFYRGVVPSGDVIFEMAAGAEGEATRLYKPVGRHAHPTDVSADGASVIFEEGEGQRAGASDDFDIHVLRLSGGPQAIPFVQTPANETQGVLSADGRWLAYSSDTSGRVEIYVQSFPDPGPRIQVSPGGGSAARWRRDGKELFYIASDGTMTAVPVVGATPIEFGKPTALFQFFTNRAPSGAAPYDVTADGQRFIVSAIVRRTDPSIQVVLNWPSLLGKKP
jgi:Tol biopolymer transport system component/tRNA A-37 threonylcarbamoyl transferase component Bud32